MTTPTTPKKFEVHFSSAVERDLRRLGPAEAARVLKQIRKKLPVAADQLGEPLHAELAGFRKLAIGQARVVYKVIQDRIWVLVLAVGKRAEGDFENIWEWLSREKVEKRLKDLIDELDGEDEEALPAGG